MSRVIRSAFLVPFFGPLPPYYEFWVKSCEANQKNFHWFVYNDTLDGISQINGAVTQIPYQFEEMKTDFKQMLDISIPGKHLRRVCDYRLMFYFLRKVRENLDEFDFIGYTDMDMVYGKLMSFMPANMKQYSMISGNDDRPCGPFTLMNRHQLHLLADWKHIKPEMERIKHCCFDESKKLLTILSKSLPPFCSATSLQPQMMKILNRRHHYAIWDNGRIIVRDCWQKKKEGGFYHFSRYKDKPRFRIDTTLSSSDRWALYKFGISTPDHIWTRMKMEASLYI